MRKIAKHAGIGAAIGCALVTLFAVGEMLGSPDAPSPGVVIVLALAMGGVLVGAPAGGVLGGLVGLIKTRRETSASDGAPAPQPTSATPTQQQTPAPTPHVGEAPGGSGGSVSPQVRESINAMRRRAAAEAEEKKPRLLAPVKPAPDPITRSGVDLRDPERLNKVLDELDALPARPLPRQGRQGACPPLRAQDRGAAVAR